MNHERSVSLISMLMTMDCPRCGFTQPRDRYCAQCGLNVEAALLQKPAWWRRVIGSPRLYGGLVALLVATVVIFFLGVKVPRLFDRGAGDYVSSREAAIPGARPAPAEPPPAQMAETPAEPEPDPVDDAEDPVPVTAHAVAASMAPDAHRFETEFFEIAHDKFLMMIEGSDRVAGDNAGRAFVVRAAEKVHAALKGGAQPVGAVFREDLKPNAQVIIATPPGAGEGLRFGMAVQLVKWDNGHAQLRFRAALAMTPFEGPGEINAGPPPRAIENTLAGPFELTSTDALVMLIEPPNRRPRAEALGKAGAGPWQILGSPHFRGGETDWIATIRLK